MRNGLRVALRFRCLPMLFEDDETPCKRFRPRDDVNGRRCGFCFRLNNEEELDGSRPKENHSINFYLDRILPDGIRRD